MERATRIAIVVTLVALLPTIPLAQDEHSLEGLAGQLTGLAERVERLLTPDAYVAEDGSCQLA